MKKWQFLLMITFLTFSCRDECRYVDPPSIVGVELEFEILQSNEENIFMTEYSIDSLQIFNEHQDSVSFKINAMTKTFGFEIFDCLEEKEKFNTDQKKHFLLQLNSTEIDTIYFEFKPIDPASECGGTDFEYLNINYKAKQYNGFYNLTVNRIYR
jgi:hypothetical protein